MCQGPGAGTEPGAGCRVPVPRNRVKHVPGDGPGAHVI